MLDILELGLLGVILWKLFGQRITTSKNGRTVILDSCALIDGRVVELSKSGFLPEDVIIPDFILHELQLLADGSDAHKRERARYGLDIAHELQDIRHLTVTIDREQIPEKSHTDDKLVVLAKKRGAMLYTTDYNLAKIAVIEDVKVLNVNELAGGLHPVVLPGEERTVKIVQKGSSTNQGVGYMEDGTMLVVENGARLVGKTVKVSVTRMHQTASGKMIFAEIITPRSATTKPADPRARMLLKKPTRRPVKPRQV
jgi:uncharacterized protein YacL